MAILAVNAGSSTLKFSLHPLQGKVVQPSVLTGSIQGLEPGGAPVLGWTFRGQGQERQLPVTSKEPFDQALHSLGELLTQIASLTPGKSVKLDVMRRQQSLTLEVTPGQRPKPKVQK